MNTTRVFNKKKEMDGVTILGTGKKKIPWRPFYQRKSETDYVAINNPSKINSLLGSIIDVRQSREWGSHSKEKL